MLSTENTSNGRTEYFRKLHRFGFHATATRAAMILRISSQPFPSRSPDPVVAHGYSLCVFTTEDVLSFCVDATCVLVVDVSRKDTNFSSSDATTCLVVDDHCESTSLSRTTWSRASPPTHFIFGSMCYRRALDWFLQSNVRGRRSLTIDMRNTYSNERGTFDSTRSRSIVELTLPSTPATSIPDSFLWCNSRLTSVDMSTLTNVTKIGLNFLYGCARLPSLDLSAMTNVREIGGSFLYGCMALSSVDLSPLANVRKIQTYFLYFCSSLTSVDLSPLANVREFGLGTLARCSALTSVDLSPLTNVSLIGKAFLYECGSLQFVDL
eukprot:PhM_4_TR18885/c2_g2_i1/m.76530